MFIALFDHGCALQRSAMSFLQSVYIPLLPERVAPTVTAYKHSAPAEQRTGAKDIYYKAANN